MHIIKHQPISTLVVDSRRSGYCVNHTWVYGAGICIWPPTFPMSGLSLILDLFLVDLDTLDTF